MAYNFFVQSGEKILFNITINQTYPLIEFVAPILGVIISASIAWIVYKQQEKEKQIKDDISNFFYIYSCIQKNLQEIYNINKQISSPALKELENAIENIDKAIELIKWGEGRGKSPLEIEIPDESKENYIKNELLKLSSKLVFEHSLRHNFLYLDKHSFEKEATMLSKYGDHHFQNICATLDNLYNIIDDIQKTIYKHNEEMIEKPRTRFKRFSFEKKDNNADTLQEIVNFKGQILYKYTIFESYDRCIKRCLLYSYTAIFHLMNFFYKYKSKNRIIMNALGIPYKDLTIEDNSILTYQEFWKYFEKYLIKDEHIYFAYPIYHHMKRTLWDKITDAIFYRKLK